MKRALFLYFILQGGLAAPFAGGQDTAIINRLNNRAWTQRESVPDSAEMLARQPLAASQIRPYWHGVGNAYATLGFITCSRNEESGFEYYQEAIRARRQDGDSCGVARIYTGIASFKKSQGVYTQALDFSHRAINILEDPDAPAFGTTTREQRLRSLAAAYFVRSEIYQMQNIAAESLKDVQRGAAALWQTRQLADSLEGQLKLAEHFYYLADSAIYADSAELYFRKILSHVQQPGTDEVFDPYNTAYINHNLALLLMNRKNPQQAKEVWALLQRCDSLFATLPSPEDSIGWCYTVIARGQWMSLYPRDTLRAIGFYERALKSYFDHIEPEKQLEVYYHLAASYRHAGKQAKAYNFLTLAYQLNDSLHNESIDRKIGDLRQEQHEIEMSRNTLALQNQKITTKNRTLLSIVLGVGMIAISLVFILFLWDARRKRAAMYQRIKTATQQFLEEVQQEERRTLGDELHGEIASPLASLAWVAETMLAKTSPNAEEYRLIELLHRRLKERAEYIRDKSHNLRFNSSGTPENSLNLDLKKHISILCDIISMTGKIRAEYEVEADNPPPHIKFHLGQVIDELVTNTLKYSNAKNITIRLEQKDDALHLYYTDDGVGFQKEKKGLGIGLADIKRRVESVNGKIISLGNRSGGGVEVEIAIPIADAPR